MTINQNKLYRAAFASFAMAIGGLGCGDNARGANGDTGTGTAEGTDTTEGTDTAEGTGTAEGTTTDTTSDDTTSDDTTSDDTTGDDTTEGPQSECGDGIVEGMEECDDEAMDSATCDADCTAAACGDGYLNEAAAEVCDDGNDVEDDGCNSLCGTANKCPQQTAIWYFGHFAGLDFTGGGEPVAITGPLSTWEGSAVISDCAGQVIASSDGSTAYDRNGDAMPNGNGDLLGGSSATQSALMFIEPGSEDSSIYLFTVQALEGGARPLHYSVIDMSLNGGLGDVDPERKNIEPSPEFVVLEYLAGVMHANESEVWVVTGDSTVFQAYLVTADGVSAPVESEVGAGLGGGGQLAASRDGTRLALAQSWGVTEIFDFDRATGILSNAVTIPSINGPYGVMFSPNGQVLYVAGYVTGTLSQYDLSVPNAEAIAASEFTFPGVHRGLLARGPDDKIYYCTWGSAAVSRINQPDALGMGADFVFDAIPLVPGTGCYHGLPNLVPGID